MLDQRREAENRAVYEFGGFVLDAGHRVLRRDSGEAIALTAKVFDTLLYLLEHRGETLDKDRLLREIWPELVVEENNLTQNISTLRQALGETRGENRFIATVPRKGYRFVADVIERDVRIPAPVVGPVGDAATPPTGPAAPSTKKSRRRPWTGAALALVFAVAALLLLQLLPRPGSPPRRMESPAPLSAVIGGTR